MNFDEYEPLEQGGLPEEEAVPEATDLPGEETPILPEEEPFDPQRFRWEDVEPPRLPKEGESGKRMRRIIALIVCLALVLSLAAVTVVMVTGNRGSAAPPPVSGEEGNEASSLPEVSEGDILLRPSGDIPNLIVSETPDYRIPEVSDGPLSVPQIAAKAKPSVVGIINYTKESGLKAANEGSGIIMTADGYIITNQHVVDGAVGVKVVLENGEEYEAKIVGTDPRADIAVIKIEAEGLTPAEFGDSTKLVSGETVVAIGNPGGLKYASSVTQGIVSAPNRLVTSATDASYIIGCIQTDTAINPGNSGGALVNIYGQVVGINSSKIMTTGFEGMGFSISIDEAKPIIDDLLLYGYVKDRVKIGISISAIDEVLANMYGLPEGLQIVSIDESSDAVAKGLLVDDIITEVDGQPVRLLTDLSAILQKKKANETITVTVYRPGAGSSAKTFKAEIVLQEDLGPRAE